MLKLLVRLHRWIETRLVRLTRHNLKGDTCPHKFVSFERFPGQWSEPLPHPHPRFADKLKCSRRETVERFHCAVCGAYLHERTVTDYSPPANA